MTKRSGAGHGWSINTLSSSFVSIIVVSLVVVVVLVTPIIASVIREDEAAGRYCTSKLGCGVVCWDIFCKSTVSELCCGATCVLWVVVVAAILSFFALSLAFSVKDVVIDVEKLYVCYTREVYDFVCYYNYWSDVNIALSVVKRELLFACFPFVFSPSSSSSSFSFSFYYCCY